MKCPKTLLLAATTVVSIGFLLTGCSTKLSPEPFDANLRLTAGQVKMTVKTGVTTQNEIFKSLGAPNVVALESGVGEIWTYDQIKVRRTAQGYGAGAFFATLFGFSDDASWSNRDPGHGGGEAGVEVSGSVGTSTTSVHTATLVIRFDANEKVASYKMLITSF